MKKRAKIAANVALRISRIIAGALLASSLIFLSTQEVRAQSGASSALAKIRQRGSIAFGVRIDTPRWGGLDPETGKITGFGPDLAQAISNQLLGKRVPVKLIPVTTQNRTAQLNSRRVDLVIATVTISESRMTEMGFSNVYMIAGQSLLVRSDSKIKSYKDLANKPVCTVVGSTPEQTIRRLVPNAKVILFNTYPECLVSLLNHRVDAVTTGVDLLRDFHNANKATTKIVGGAFTFEAWGVMARKGDRALIDAVNTALAKIKKDGTYKKIYEKWVGPSVPSNIDSWYGMSPGRAAELFAQSKLQ